MAGDADPWHAEREVIKPHRALSGQTPGLIGGGGLDISRDGAFVADIAAAPQGFPGCATDNCSAYVVADVAAGTVTAVGVAWDGAYIPSVIFTRPALSDDGNVIVFEQNASTQDGVYVRDLRQADSFRADVTSDGSPFTSPGRDVAISGDGKIVAFSSRTTNEGDPGNCTNFGATDKCPQVYVHDVVTGETARVSVTDGGLAANGSNAAPSLSYDGRYVAFTSTASNLHSGTPNDGCPDSNNTTQNCRDVYVRDTVAGTTTLVSVDSSGDPGNGDSSSPSISGDGKTVAFQSKASDLVPADSNTSTDIFVRDLVAQTTERVDITDAGAQTSDGNSSQPSISADGNRVAFWSDATTLDPQGPATCGPSPVRCADIFVRERDTGHTYKVSVNADGDDADGRSDHPAISADGRYVVFTSAAPNLVQGVNGGTFLAERSGLTWGDIDCSGSITGYDALIVLRFKAGITNGGATCPTIGGSVQITATQTWGDVDCSGQIDAVDAAVILAYASGLTPGDASAGCPQIGAEVTETEGT
jgi:Tol biopolymer transport system component